MARPRKCVGCEESVPRKDAISVKGLGWVCPLCNEVVDIVFEVEIERMRTASAQVRAFVAKLEGSHG